MCFVRLYFVFFFFKQKTAYEMRISDWISDVCSSDLGNLPVVIAIVKSHEDGLALCIVEQGQRMQQARGRRFPGGRQCGQDVGPGGQAGADPARLARSEERRVGTGCVSTCGSSWKSYP